MATMARDNRAGVGRRELLAAGGLGGLSMLGLTGCETIGQAAVPEMPIWANRPGGALSVAFRRQLADITKITDIAYERGKPGIDRDGLRVFVPSQDGGLYAVDARNGDVAWRFATLGPVQSEPL